jgi:hypothetical protein
VTGEGAVSLGLGLSGSALLGNLGSGSVQIDLSLSGDGTRTNAVSLGTGKYKPEHDSALVEIAGSTGFTQEHAGAVEAIEQSTGFANEHRSALKDLFDAGV